MLLLTMESNSQLKNKSWLYVKCITRSSRHPTMTLIMRSSLYRLHFSRFPLSRLPGREESVWRSRHLLRSARVRSRRRQRLQELLLRVRAELHRLRAGGQVRPRALLRRLFGPGTGTFINDVTKDPKCRFNKKKNYEKFIS